MPCPFIQLAEHSTSAIRHYVCDRTYCADCGTSCPGLGKLRTHCLSERFEGCTDYAETRALWATPTRRQRAL